MLLTKRIIISMDWRERLGVTEGLQKTTVLCAGLLFAVTAAFIILKTARDGLVLSDYSANTLPWFMAITTVATAVVAATYIRLYKKLSLGPAVELSLKTFAVGTLILWGGIKSGWSLATPILYVWTGIYGALAPVQSWSIITQQLLTRQAKTGSWNHWRGWNSGSKRRRFFLHLGRSGLQRNHAFTHSDDSHSAVSCSLSRLYPFLEPLFRLPQKKSNRQKCVLALSFWCWWLSEYLPSLQLLPIFNSK